MTDPYHTTSKRLIHNTVFNVVALVSSAGVTFFLIRFLLAHLGETRYGVWVLIGSIFQYRRLLDMGMNSSIDRYIPMNLARRDHGAVQRVISTSLLFFSALAVVLGLATILLYDNIGAWFAIAPDMVRTAGVLVLIVGSTFALAMPLQVSSAVLCGLQRYDVLNLVELLILLLRTVLVIILLHLGYGLLTLGLVFGGSEILVKSVQFIFARRLLPELAITLKSIDLTLLKQMLAYGINTFLYRTGGLLLLKASDLLIAIFIGTAEVSQFSVAVAGILLLSQMLRAFTTAIKPAVSDLDARDEHSRVREISLLMQKYSLLLIIPAACFFIVMGGDFLHVWVGKEFAEPGVVDRMGFMLAILTVGHCLRLAQYSNFLVLVGKGEHRFFGLLTIVMGLLSIATSIVSVKIFNLGLLAITWSNCVPMALISGIILPAYFNMKMKIAIRETVVSVWRPALLGSMPTVIVIVGWKYIHSPSSWSSIAAVVAVSIGLTGLSAWRFSLTARERQRLWSTLLCPWRRDSSIVTGAHPAVTPRRTEQQHAALHRPDGAQTKPIEAVMHKSMPQRV